MPGQGSAGTDSTDRYTVRSIARAIGVLEVLAARGTSDGLGVTEIANACAVPKSVAYTTLYTLHQHGLVAVDGQGQRRRYRLGLALSRLGERAREQLSLPGLARPVLRSLSSSTGLSARLAVLQGDAAVAIDRVESPGQVRIDLRMGARELMHCTGIGKAILAYLPSDTVRSILGSTGLPQRTPHTITDLEVLFKHLDTIRQIGYAIDDEEDAEGIICVGSPVRDQWGTSVAAISVTGLKAAISTDRCRQLGEATQAAAAGLSQQLGLDQTLSAAQT